MAISAIDLFQPNQSIIGRMLAGGSGVFADAIQSTVRSAAGLSDNQVRQERDFLMEQRNETNLAQRRAENLRSAFEADRLFDFRERTDERDFGFRMDQADRLDSDRDRAFEQSKAASDAALGIRKEELGLSKERVGVAKDQLQIEKDKAKREQDFIETILTPEYGPKLPGAEVTPEEIFAVADAKQDAAAQAKNGPAFVAATREKARAKAELDKQGADPNKPLTPAELRAQRKEAAGLEAAAAKKLEDEAKELVADKTAFAPQLGFVPTDPKTGKPELAAYTAAEAFDKDPFTSEKLVAKASTKEEFVAKGGSGLNDVQKKRRARFWEIVNGKGAAAPERNAEVSGWMDKNLIE